MLIHLAINKTRHTGRQAKSCELNLEKTEKDLRRTALNWGHERKHEKRFCALMQPKTFRSNTIRSNSAKNRPALVSDMQIDTLQEIALQLANLSVGKIGLEERCRESVTAYLLVFLIP